MQQTNFEVALYLTANLFRIFVMMHYAYFCFRERKVPDWIEWFAYIGYFGLNSICYFLFHNQIINLLTNVIPFFCLTFLRKGKLSIRIFSVVGVYAVSMVVDSIYFSIEGALGVESIFIQYGVASSLTVFGILVMLEKLTGKYNDGVKPLYLVAVISIPLLSIIVGIFTMQYSQYQTAPIYVLVECVVLLLINCIVFILLDVLSKNHVQEIEKMQLNDQNRMYIHQIEILELSQNRIRFLKHDMKNHLSHVRELAGQNQCADIIEYIDQAIGRTEHSGTFVDSGNHVVDSILNLKLSEADAVQAEIHTEITLPEDLPIVVFDINIILGNLLDNAITALKHCEQRRLFVKLNYAAGSLFISVRNTYHNNGLSDKKDTDDEHGIGLKSVKSVLDRYNGDMEIRKEDGVFSVSTIMLL